MPPLKHGYTISLLKSPFVRGESYLCKRNVIASEMMTILRYVRALMSDFSYT